MIHRHIVSEMSKADIPHAKISNACRSILKRRPHLNYFENIAPLACEIIPLSAQISPSALLSSSGLRKRKAGASLILELAGGICTVTRNAMAVKSRIESLEAGLEESMRKVDFEKLQKKEKWYGVLRKTLILPAEISAYSAILMAAGCLIFDSLFGISRILGESGRNGLLFSSLTLAGAALAFSRAMDLLVNPAISELKKSISDLRE
ncbi:MAG: hypothetical protein QXH30_03735, partial [Candidatus Bilamarchaeaceae archaeon]